MSAVAVFGSKPPHPLMMCVIALNVDKTPKGATTPPVASLLVLKPSGVAHFSSLMLGGNKKQWWVRTDQTPVEE